jgi:hypothetical protein
MKTFLIMIFLLIFIIACSLEMKNIIKQTFVNENMKGIIKYRLKDNLMG